MNVLILAALTEATGNSTTARRLARHIGRAHNVSLVNANNINLNDLKSIVDREKIEVAIGLHALLAGPFLQALKLPYALILGGTDLYQEMHELYQKQMSRAVLSAGEIIAFSKQNLFQAKQLWHGLSARGVCLPQAVDVSEIDRSFHIKENLGIDTNARLVLLPAGIRHIKDPLHLAQAFSRLHHENPQVVFGVVGPVLEHDFAQDVLRTIRTLAGVHYLHALPRPQLLGAIEQSDVILNTSLAEGMSGTILEAMALNVPVVARHNDGNDSLIQHGETGFLYEEPHEAINYVENLLNSGPLRAQVTRTCQSYLAQRHTIEQEFTSYQEILYRLLESFATPSSQRSSGAP